jgi:putative Mn2+ efflux pump MntP
MLLLAFAKSIDAFAAGIAFAFFNVLNIIYKGLQMKKANH